MHPVCLPLKRTVEALEVLGRLADRPPKSPAQNDALGNLYSRVGRQELARNCFQAAVDAGPEVAHYWLNLALCRQATGEMKEAERAFDRCIELNPDDAEPWLHRSRLRTQSAQNNHVGQLRAAADRAASDWRGQVSLFYALAKESEDLGRYDESFSALHAGASLRRGHMRHDADADLKAIAAIKQSFSGECLATGAPGYDNCEPIFIVGLPRTGTTLVERILGSHNEVFAAGELNNFAECLTAQIAPKQPTGRMDFIRLATAVDSAQLGRDYIESTRPLTGHTERFIDKLPLNFLYCGLIHKALPGAKIIHLKRDPMDTCFAIYKHCSSRPTLFLMISSNLGTTTWPTGNLWSTGTR